MKSSILWVLMILGWVATKAQAQDTLEPLEDFWAIRDLDCLAEARDSLLLGFQTRPLIRAISIPDDGYDWAVCIEQVSDSTSLVRAALANGSLGIRANATKDEKLAMIRRSVIERSTREISREVSDRVYLLFRSTISNARYPRFIPNVIDGGMLYFAAYSEPPEELLTARINSPAKETQPGFLTSLAASLLNYARGSSADSARHLLDIRAAIKRLEN